MNLRTVNLNLIKTLHALLRTRSVTLASKELYITQPAVSAALKQLRDIFEDELFLKGQNGVLELTHKAKLLQPKVNDLIKQTENLIDFTEEKIIPEKINETFHLAMHSHVSHLIFPKLYKTLDKIAPNVKIQETDVTDLSELSTRELHQFDFIIGSFRTIPKNYIREFYFSDQFVCLSGNPAVNAKSHITIKDLNQNEHVILSYLNNYTKTYSEKLLVENGIKRKYKMIVSNASLAVELAYRESLLLLIMKKRAEALKYFKLKTFELPFTVPELKTDILYKETDANIPVYQWFKSILLQLCANEIKSVHD